MSSIIINVAPHHLPNVLWLQEIGVLEIGCDMVLIDNAAAFLDRVKETGRFGNIFLQTDRFKGLNYLSRMQRVKQLLERQPHQYRHKLKYLRYCRPYHLFSAARKDYDRVFFPDPALVPEYLWCYDGILRGEPPEMAVWEHATGSYSRGTEYCDDWVRSHAFGLIMDAYRIPYHGHHTINNYVFIPELVEDFGPSVHSIRIPPIDRRNQDFVELINKLFRVTESDFEDLATRDYILFDNPFAASNKRCREAAEVATRVVGKDAFMVKHRPGSSTELYSGIYIMKSRDIPWEVYVLNSPDIDEKVFIVTVSSIAFSAKLRFGAEPYIITLAKLQDMSFPMFDRVKDLYRDPDKMFSPKDMKEFEDALESILTKKAYRRELADTPAEREPFA